MDAEFSGEFKLTWTVMIVVLLIRWATATLFGCLRVSGAMCVARAVRGGVSSCVTGDVLLGL